MYLEGKGTKQSNSKAFKWLKKAALQNEPSAQYLLALMYIEGKGVKKSKKKATQWMEKAAKQGIKEAQIWLEAQKSNNK